MKLILFVLILIGSVQIITAQTKDSVIDTGKLVMLAGGAEMGSDSFTILNSDKAEGNVAVGAGAQQQKFKTVTEYHGTQPTLFSVDRDPDLKLTFTINGADIKVTGTNETTGKTDPAALIMENYVWHQYYFLLKRYDLKKGGAQDFQCLVPTVLRTIPMTLELLQTSVTVDGVPNKLNHFRVIAQL